MLVSAPSKILRALFLQVGGSDLGRLTGEVPEILRPAALLHGLQHHAVRRRAERHRDELAFEVRELVVRRVLVHHHAVAAAEGVVGDDGDELRLVLVRLPGRAVHQQRVIAHHADVDLVRHHAVGDRRPGGEVLPIELVGEVLVLAGLR
jgi:hypothetical protein